MRDVATWTAIITAIAALVGAWINWRKTPSAIRKQNVSTDLLISTEARQLLVEYRTERAQMREELDQLKTDLAEARLAIRRLEGWIVKNGGDLEEIHATG